MPEFLINVPTLLICTSLSTLVVATFLTQHWFSNRRAVAVGYWSVAMWAGTVSSVLLALRETISPFLSIGVGNVLATLGYALTWAGFRAFDHQPVSRLVVLAGAAAWSGAYLLSDTFAGDINLRIILMSVVVSGYSMLMASELLRGHKVEALPSRRVIAIMLATHAAIYLLRVPFALFAPVAGAPITSVSPWFAVFALEIFMHTLVVSVAVLVLTKERSEYVYRHAARSDALTGILNRGAFMEEVSAQLSRQPQSGVLLLLDLDHFKSVNDTHGHLAGDKVLRRLTSAIGARLGERMVFGRFGGEEFALYAPDLDLEEGAVFAEVLRADVAALSIGHFDNLISATVSIGVASSVLSGGDVDTLIGAADFALYQAKADGRNTISVSGPAEGLTQVADRLRAPDVFHMARFRAS